MEAFTQDAIDRGAQLAAGGERIAGAGNFWLPTVLANVPTQAKVFNEEPFGPVAAIRSFERLEEAVTEANRLPYGLAAYAFTRSLKNADLPTRHIEAGMLWINTSAITSAEMPFGGIKDSGHGSEGGPEALEAYLNTRAVAVMNG
jgi:succinate-semialdehyde dehydrogenase/glutarate-semialdehyde dehydrogenase